MVHAFFNPPRPKSFRFCFFLKYLPPPIMPVTTSLTCQLTCPHLQLKNTALMLEKQANRIVLHHIQGGKNSQKSQKGRTVKMLRQEREGRTLKGRPASCLWWCLRATYRSLRAKYSATQTLMPFQFNKAPVLREGHWCWEGRICRIIYFTCTEHHGSFSFSLTTYLFSLLGQSPIIWQWKHRKMYRTITCLEAFVWTVLSSKNR